MAAAIFVAACGDDDGGGGGGPGGSAGSSGSGTGGSSGSGGGSGGSSGSSTGGSSGSASGGSSGSASGGSSGSATGGSAGAASGGSAGSTGGAGGGTGGSAGSAGSNTDIPGGGTILFQEDFDDANFQARGWYDGPSGTISTTEHAPGSTSSYQCQFNQGATTCANGKPARHKFTASPTVYASFWLKFSTNWVGSGVAYHPHMMHFINDLDSDYVGPAHTYLTTYIEVIQNGRAFLGLQDSKNVDLNCILLNNGNFQGCNGDFATYPFTENRSVCACNGIAGELDGKDCFSNGNGTWYSSRSWRADNAFIDAAGPNYKADWHFVEVYFEMNSIQGGAGIPNGKIRWVQDGVTLISSDQILMRTNQHANLMFHQFAMLPYIGDGSPIQQSFWVDDLTVATARP
jgi:hypothetical protein